jgi:hypothetical protein
VGHVRSQQVKSRIKFASNLGMYDEEWNEGDCCVMYGDVPAINMLFPGTMRLAMRPAKNVEQSFEEGIRDTHE